MVNYVTHDQVPKEVKLLLKELEGIDNIQDYNISHINRLIAECENEANSLSKYKNYEVEYQGPGDRVSQKVKFNNLEEAFVCLDRLTNYGKETRVTLILSQAGKPVRGYHNGQWIYPQNLYDR